MAVTEQGVDGDQVFHLRWYSRLVGSLFVFYCIVFLMVIPFPQASLRLVGTGGVVVCTAFAIRGFRCATVLLRADAITIRGFFRTRTIPWKDIVEARPGRGSSAAGVGWAVPALVLADGRTVRIQEIRTRRFNGSLVEGVLSAIVSRLTGSPQDGHTTMAG